LSQNRPKLGEFGRKTAPFCEYELLSASVNCYGDAQAGGRRGRPLQSLFAGRRLWQIDADLERVGFSVRMGVALSLSKIWAMCQVQA
jgi:hypothetical protein